MTCSQEDVELLKSYGIYDSITKKVNLQVVEMYCKMFVSVVSNCPLCTEVMDRIVDLSPDLENLGKIIVKIVLSKATTASEQCIESLATPNVLRVCIEAVKEVLGK